MNLVLGNALVTSVQVLSGVVITLVALALIATIIKATAKKFHNKSTPEVVGGESTLLDSMIGESLTYTVSEYIFADDGDAYEFTGFVADNRITVAVLDNFTYSHTYTLTVEEGSNFTLDDILFRVDKLDVAGNSISLTVIEKIEG